jgi:hypothetical protein
MTSEELVATGLPLVEEGMHRTKVSQPSEENLGADGSENREEGEIGSEEENIEDVDADLKISFPRNDQNLSLRLLFSVNLKSLQI